MPVVRSARYRLGLHGMSFRPIVKAGASIGRERSAGGPQSWNIEAVYAIVLLSAAFHLTVAS
jgi:hypothetical protein